MAIHFSRFARLRAVLFRIFYSTTFTIVFLLVIAFACGGAIDSIYQSYRRGRLIDVFSLAGAYFITGLISTFLYASRLYTNRSLLRDIPKTYMPIDKGEVGNRRMWRLVEDCKGRSAVTAYLARPRSRRIELEVVSARERITALLKPEHSKERCEYEPQWGVISHPGWTSPAAKETPNLQYETVIRELLDLVEARAVSLAPLTRISDEPGIDEHLIETLQCPETSSMREYLFRLVELDVLTYDDLTATFLKHYEQARFGPEPLTEANFTTLMRMFAELLRNMRPVALPQTNSDHMSSTSSTSSMLPSNHPSLVLQVAQQREISRDTESVKSSSTNLSSQAGSVRRYQIEQESQTLSMPFLTAPGPSFLPPRMSNDSVRSVSSKSAYHDIEDQSWTEPTSRPPFFRSRSSTSARSRGSRTKINREPHRSRLRRAMSRASIGTTSSSPSLKSAKSNGSVIRLNADYNGSRNQLPYEYVDVLPVEGSNAHKRQHARRDA